MALSLSLIELPSTNDHWSAGTGVRLVRRALAHGQHRARVWSGRRRLVGELERLQRAAARARDPFLAHRLGDRLAPDCHSVATGAVRPRPLLARGASGSQPDQTIDPAAAHREAVADIGERLRIVHALRAVGDVAEQHLAAAIVDLVEDAAVALGRVLGPQHEEVGRVLDHAARVARRLVDQRDALVAGRIGIDLALGDADHLLIGADRAERGAVGQRLDGLDLDRDDHGSALGGFGALVGRRLARVEVQLHADAVGIVEEDLRAAGARDRSARGTSPSCPRCACARRRGRWRRKRCGRSGRCRRTSSRCRARRCPRAACARPADARSARRRNRASSPGSRAADGRRSRGPARRNRSPWWLSRFEGSMV